MAIKIAQYDSKRSLRHFSKNASEEDLLLQFQHGDEYALNELMARHRGVVWRVAKQYLGSFSEAEDLYQDILLSILQNPGCYQCGTAKFSSWLYRVAVNRCLDIVRSKGYITKQNTLDETIPTGLPNAEDNISRHEISTQLRDLLNILPHHQKTALYLYYYEDRNLAFISQSLSVTEGAARALIKRGREKLRDVSATSELL